jgi:hypothetical protein
MPVPREEEIERTVEAAKRFVHEVDDFFSMQASSDVAHEVR